MVMTEAEYRNAEKAGRGGVYVFCGVESYLIRHYRDRARAPYRDPAAAFDHINVTYGSREDAGAIIDATATPMMMGMMGIMGMMGAPDTGVRRRLVEVTVESLDSLSGGDVDALIDALMEAAAYDDAFVLVCLMPGTFDCGDVPKRPSATYKRLCATEGINVVYFPATTPAQLRRWVERHFTHEGLAPDYDTADTLITLSGTDMTSLSGEIDKLVAYAKSHGRDRVTAADVNAICCRGEKYDAFALSNAILDVSASRAGARDAALSALYDERRRRTEPIIVSAGIARVITDILTVKVMMESGARSLQIAGKLGMHEYKVSLYMKSAARRTVSDIERAVLACAEADRLLKSSGAGYEALERLICTVGVR